MHVSFIFTIFICNDNLCVWVEHRMWKFQNNVQLKCWCIQFHFCFDDIVRDRNVAKSFTIKINDTTDSLVILNGFVSINLNQNKRSHILKLTAHFINYISRFLFSVCHKNSHNKCSVNAKIINLTFNYTHT